MSAETPDFTATLLNAEPAERESLLRAADADALSAALAVLGHTREPAAAEVLALIDDVVDDRAIRKAARRELHRLRSTGVEPPAHAPQAMQTQTAQPAPLSVSQAWATDIDATGSRALWLLAERPLGGVWFAALLLNDLTGLPEMSLIDTTRKRFQRELEDARRQPGTWVSLPGEYALHLAREAVDVTREIGAGLPTRYHAFQEVFGEAPGPPDRGLLFETISPVEVNFNPGWLDESPRLLGEPELGGWFVQMPPDLRARALEVARAPSVGLLVPGHTPEQQALSLVSDATREALTPKVRRAFRRRLEETSYIFLQTDRLSAARLAAAAALGLGEGGPSPDRHPLVRLFIAAGLARLIGGETVGARRASDVLLELVDRAGQQADTSPVETRPSGLILPR